MVSSDAADCRNVGSLLQKHKSQSRPILTVGTVGAAGASGGRQRTGRAASAPPFAGRDRAGGAMPCRLIAAPSPRHDGKSQEARDAVANPDLIIAIVVIAVAALALLFGIWWLWWRLPKWQVDRLALKIRDPKARADFEDNFRKTVVQTLGGAAVLIGAPHARCRTAST